MDQTTKSHIANLHISDPQKRYESFQFVIKLALQPVDWAYEVWDDLLSMTKTGDNHQRTIAVQLLSSLAKSDPEQRMLRDLDKLMLVTKDEKFVTARHSIMSLWKIGIVNDELKKKVIDRLSKRFKECSTEKNCTLIRYDILEVIRKIYDQVPDEKLRDKAQALIETEDDPKYRKKYSGLWKEFLKPARQKK